MGVKIFVYRKEHGTVKFEPFCCFHLLSSFANFVVIAISKQFLKFYVAYAIFKDSVKLLRKIQKRKIAGGY